MWIFEGVESRISTIRSPFCFAEILAVPTMIHTPSNIKSRNINYYYITWVEIDRKCNKLTDSMSRFPKWLASLYVLTNKHTSTPEEIICQCPVARVACPVCSAESHRNWKKRHESLLPHAKHEKYGHKDTRRELWLVSYRQRRGVFAVLLIFLSKVLISHSQHRHADIAKTIPMLRRNVRAHRRGLVTACHAWETIF